MEAHRHVIDTSTDNLSICQRMHVLLEQNESRRSFLKGNIEVNQLFSLKKRLCLLTGTRLRPQSRGLNFMIKMFILVTMYPKNIVFLSFQPWLARLYNYLR